MDRSSAVAAIDLLSHWWTRPIESEVDTWPAATEIEEEVLSQLSEGGERGSVTPLCSAMGESASLLDEYERLFVGPGPVPCPPYESFWREDVPVDIRRSLMGPCTAEVKELYAELSLQVSPASGELADHVAIELEALAYALSDDSTSPVARELFFGHLRGFLPRLCRALAHSAELPFYRELAAVTMSWIKPIERYLEPADAPS